MARVKELEAMEATRPLTQDEFLESMELIWPGYFSSLEAAQPLPQLGHAARRAGPRSASTCRPSWQCRRAARCRPGLCTASWIRCRVTASTDTAELWGAVVDVLPGDGHIPWLEDRGCVRRSLDSLLPASD